MSSNCSMDLQMIFDYITICKIVCREGYAVILNPELTGILNLVLLITRDLYHRQAVCFQETNRSFVLEVSRNNISSMWRYERVLDFYILWHVTYFVMFLVSGRVSVSNSKFHCHWETKWIRGGGTRAGRTYSWARDGWCCNSTKIRLLLRVRGGWEFKGPKQDPKIPHQPK